LIFSNFSNLEIQGDITSSKLSTSSSGLLAQIISGERNPHVD